MKRTGRLLLTALILALLLILAALPASAAEYVSVINTGTLNVRSGPDASYAKLGYVSRDEWVEVLGESGNWYYVRTLNGSLQGYASKTYLSDRESGTQSNVGVVTNPVATQFLNLRQYPSVSAPVIGIFYNGTVCTILDVTGEWYHVDVAGQQGYFMQDFVTRQSGGTSATVHTQNGGSLNLRSGPTTSSQVIGKCANGSRLTVLRAGKGFYRVSTASGQIGYAASEYLRTGSDNPDPPVPPVSGYEGYVVVKNSYSSYVNLRKTASSSGKVLSKAKNGLRFEVITAGSEWCRVRGAASGTEGYMMTRYLEIHDCSPYHTVKNGNSYVNLRSGAGKNYRVYAQVPSGSVVTVVTPGPSWSKVTYNGRTGYMMTSFLK